MFQPTKCPSNRVRLVKHGRHVFYPDFNPVLRCRTGKKVAITDVLCGNRLETRRAIELKSQTSDGVREMRRHHPGRRSRWRCCDPSSSLGSAQVATLLPCQLLFLLSASYSISQAPPISTEFFLTSQTRLSWTLTFSIRCMSAFHFSFFRIFFQ